MACALALGLRGGSARAAKACRAPYVRIDLDAPEDAGVDARAVIERLEVELAGRGVSLCSQPPAGGEGALASVHVGAGASAHGASVKLDIEVRDDVTEKRVAREVDLEGTPRDERSLVIALAADELLRASWAELALDRSGSAVAGRERAPKPRAPISPEVREAITPELRARQRASWLSLGVAGAAEAWTGGVTAFGADAVIALRPSPRLALGLAVGARAALAVAAPDGSMSARGVVFRVGPEIALTEPGRAAWLAWSARAGLYLVALEGDAAPTATADSATRAAFALDTGPRLHVALPSVAASLVVGADVGAALRAVGLDDGAARVASLGGAGFLATLGVATGLP
jgi:hypothetical protein